MTSRKRTRGRLLATLKLSGGKIMVGSGSCHVSVPTWDPTGGVDFLKVTWRLIYHVQATFSQSIYLGLFTLFVFSFFNLKDFVYFTN